MILAVVPVRRGKQDAKVACDECGSEVSLAVSTGQQGGTRGRAEDGPINKKLAERGWRVLKKGHLCPACQDAGNECEGDDMALSKVEEASAPSAQLTRETRRAIRALLDDVYDIDAGRYRGDETDKTVAATVGSGCLADWVEAERRDGYGDGGGNEAQLGAAADLDTLRAELDAALAELTKERSAAVNAVQDTYAKSLSTLNALRDQVDKMRRDVAALGKRFPKGI